MESVSVEVYEQKNVLWNSLKQKTSPHTQQPCCHETKAGLCSDTGIMFDVVNQSFSTKRLASWHAENGVQMIITGNTCSCLKKMLQKMSLYCRTLQLERA